MNKSSSKTGHLDEQKLALLARMLEAEGLPQAPSIKRIPRDGELPLSFAQMGLWLDDRIAPNSAAYNSAASYDIKGHLDLMALEYAFSEIVRRHEVLRTFYPSVDGRPVQKIASAEPTRIAVMDLQGLSPAELEKESARRASVITCEPFQLATGPLLRVELWKVAPELHELWVVVHHIAFDWWSFGVLEREWAALYNSFLRGESPPLPELTAQYVDFAAWQRECLQGEFLKAHANYWKLQLGGPLPFLDLPTDAPRPAVRTSAGSRVTLVLPARLSEALKALSQGEGVTLFVTLLGAFDVLLLRYTGQKDLLVGVPMTTRHRPETEEMVGFFVNTVVMRTDASGDPTFRELLKRVHKTVVGALEHQDLPFEKLVELVNPIRDASRSPIFQVALSMLNIPIQPVGVPKLEIMRREQGNGTSKFDFVLYVAEGPAGLTLTWEYNTDLFRADRMDRMLGHFRVLLEGIVASPKHRLSELPLMPEAEHRQLLVEYNRTAVDFPRKQCIHELFEQQAALSPDSPAVEFGGSLLSYRDLNHRANQLGHYLRAIGVGAETPVGVCMNRSAHLLVALLGILKAGGAYVPIDPAYPRQRLEYILEDSQAPVVLTEQSILDCLPKFTGQIICLDQEWSTIARESRENVAAEVKPENLAYVLFTSGSTGRPKGVAIPHRAGVNFVHWAKEIFTPQELASVLFSTSVCFDLSVFEMFATLSVGGKIVVVPNVLHLVSRPERTSLTLINTVPSAIAELLRMGAIPDSVKTVNLAGEPLTAELVEQLYATTRLEKVYNLYGPTETTTYSTYTLVPRGGAVTIGRPIANTRVYIVDSHLQPVPMGVPGELLIGGAGLARGYWNRPELTAEKFIADPFCRDGRSQLYRTGDLVRHRTDGSLEFLGRIDQQVKLRGFRIELGEIESVLTSHPGVREAVVVVRGDDEKVLVAYFVPSVKSVGSAELRDYLKGKLPIYMVPSAFMALEKLPTTPNGKIDRKALPPPRQESDTSPSGSGQPTDMLEQQLTHLWRRVLGVRHVGPDDDFFEIGGHSLGAARLFYEIERLTGEKLPLATLFHASTVRKLSEVLRRDGWSPHWPSLVPINAGGSRLPLFLVHGAEGNVLLYRQLARCLGPDQPVYALQSQGLNGGQMAPTSVEEMASKYIQELTSLQPSGPYLLGGYCLGGTIAFEIAQQLQARGERVGLVAMLETYNISLIAKSKPLAWELVYFLQDMWFHGANFFLAGSRDRWSFFREKWATAMSRLEARLGSMYQGWASSDRQNFYPHLRVKEVNDQAALHYSPRPYSGRVAVLRPMRNFWRIDDPTFGWGDVVREGLAIREIPAYPKGMLVEPFVGALAQELTVWLNEANKD